LLAQTLQTSQTPQAARAVERELQAQLQLATPYRKWLNEDVAYIIIDNERSTFKSLTTDGQREQFIDQFWQRRDPTPGTPENEFKEEHYRRIAYANEHFTTASGLPGWKTDQGRIYITYGPPNEIEDHSSGGSYTRPAEEGGGTISAFPFQQWRYRYIDGIGNNIVIEFIDPTYTREFRMTMDPAEKDALRYVQGTNAPQPANMFVSAGDGPKVSVSIASSASEKKNMYVSFALPSAPARYDITAQVTDIYDHAVANLKDVTAAGQFNYTSRFTMKPGSYNLKVTVRDPASGAMQTSTVNFYVN
jgi:GWxTD domain-containing protein